MEVFEAVEAAVTQLSNLGALRFIKEDFGLISKLISKLPLDDQKRYDEYATAEAISEDPASEWDKFWVFMEKIHKSAVQGNLRTMCTKPSAAPSGASGIKSGVTCIACGGLGHFARSCPSKIKSVKVNVAVSKITTK